MQEAAPEGTGAMAALMGIEPDAAAALCAAVAPGGECQPANFNSPGQVVISGAAEFVGKAIAAAKEKTSNGGRSVKAVPLNVSAPFHSRLMAPAAEKLRARFGAYKWSDPAWPIVCNASAVPLSSADELRAALYEQTCSPVRWTESVARMADDGVELFLELGPGDVLSSLIKRCRKGVGVLAAGTPEKLEAMAKLLLESPGLNSKKAGES
jgi:[acyl-carrier-protein] S-malonyltransferase